jgi:hypothetical protein
MGVLNVKAAVLEDAAHGDERVTAVQMDYHSWFDKLIREMAWATTRGRMLPETTVQLFEINIWGA